MSQFSYQTVMSNVDDYGVRQISLNRPERLNAMNARLIADVTQAFNDANQDAATRAIVFSGQGRAFCAGDDRKEHVQPQSEAEARAFVDAIQQATRAILFGSKPVVGAINGWAVGGGFEWAINCDFSVWGKSAKAFFPEVSLNLFVTGAVTSLLPAMTGLNKAREMLLLGEHYTAEELLQLGVAWRVVADDEVAQLALQTAIRLAELPELSLRAMKQALNRNAVVSIEQALAIETEATVAGFMDPETTRRLLEF